MYELKIAKDILGIRENISIDDIKQICDNFIEFISSVNSNEYTDYICDYLISIKTIFYERYKTNQMTSKEYQIWKVCLEDDFSEVSAEIKNKIKQLFMQRIIIILRDNLLKNKTKNNLENNCNMHNEKYSKIESYNEYKIDEFKTIGFTNIKINYEPRKKALLWFSLIIVILNLFFSLAYHIVESGNTRTTEPQQEINNNQIDEDNNIISETEG